jgi:nucleoside-diphosphate-sugar epimerase
MSFFRHPLPERDLQYICSETASIWQEAFGARIFITGGSGFFGTWLVESFCTANQTFKLGAHLTILTRNANFIRECAPRIANSPEVQFLVGDIKELDLRSERFDFAIHAASETSPGYEAINPTSLLLGNIEGTRRFLNLVHNAGVRKFLFTSSGGAYGTQPSEVQRLVESQNFAPLTTASNSAYGESKRVSEALCSYHSKAGICEGKIARCFAFLGPRLPLDANYAIGNFVRDALARRPIIISGDGTPRRSYLYSADLAIWLWTMLFRGRSGHIYNVGGSIDLSISEVADLVRTTIFPNGTIETKSIRDPSIPLHRYVPSIEKAREELGLVPKIELAEAIRRMAAWHLDSIQSPTGKSRL